MFQTAWQAFLACIPFLAGVYLLSTVIVFVAAVFFLVDEVRRERVLTLGAVIGVLACSFLPVVNTFLMFLPLIAFLSRWLEGPFDRLIARLDAIHLFRLKGHVLQRSLNLKSDGWGAGNPRPSDGFGEG